MKMMMMVKDGEREKGNNEDWSPTDIMVYTEGRGITEDGKEGQMKQW